MKERDLAKHLAHAWPKIERALDANTSPVLKRRPPTYDDKTVFKALLLYVWRGLPIRACLGRGYPMGAVLHRRWLIWRDAGALRAMVGAYARALPKDYLAAWRERLEEYDHQVRDHGTRNPAMAWLMVNRFWYEAVAVPLLNAGGRLGQNT